LIADGTWRDSALAFARAFYLFDSDTLEEARSAWRSLAGRDQLERHYWANDNGRWVEKSAS
jgi:DNA polymerase-3 subunit chi